MNPTAHFAPWNNGRGYICKRYFLLLDLVVMKGRGAVSDCREHLARPERRLHPWMVSNAILALNFEAVY